MFRTKTFSSLALLLTLCVLNAPNASAQDATQARRAQTEGAFAFAFGGGNHLGVSVESVTRENMSGLNLRGEPRGVVVRNVAEGGPAAKGGLQTNDVILRFDGEQVSSPQKLQRLINESAPEHTARLSISRGGAEQELSVTLGKRESFAPQAFGSFKMPDVQAFGLNSEEFKRNTEKWRRDSEEWKRRAKELGLNNSEEMRKHLEKFRAEGSGNNFTRVYGTGGRRLGISTQELNGQLADYFGVADRGGLLVTSVVENSPAAKAGLKAGDVLTEIDGTQLRNAGELSRALNRRDEGEVTLTIRRERKTRTIKVTPDRMQDHPMFFRPGGLGAHPNAIAPMALIAPRVSVAPMRAMPAPPATGLLPVRPATPAVPHLTPLVAPRPAVAPRIYVAPPVAPARPGVWVL
jgi:C-terminal processing protease CtpA/Prc